ncbi:putative glutaminase protein [Rutstroemia sp. NJR-2017a WRK4]|nr:putative glutaminase protein [Rutstroemia sp. NJR-2017a WRK4]
MTPNYKTFASSPPPEPSGSQDEEASSLSPKQKFLEPDRYAKMMMYCRRGLFFLFAAILIAVAIFVPVTRAQHQHRDTSYSILYEPILPPSYPLAVRNPYLSAWIPGPLVSNIGSSNAQFWAGQNLIWSVIARVDNVTYNLFGVASPGSGTKYGSITSAKYTATHSIFNITAGNVSFGLDFFSPVSTGNYLRQSLPFSYLTVTSSSSAPANVQVYSDIGGSWTGQTTSSSWTFTKQDTTSMFGITANGRARYSESSDQALWGEAIYASQPSSSSVLTTQAGDRTTVRKVFSSSGALAGTVGTWTSDGVTGLSHDLGSVSGSSSVTYAVGYVREAAVNYLGTPYTGYYRATYPKTINALVHFFDDYEDALTESNTIDSELESQSSQVAGTNYSDITALSLRQVFGGIDLVIPNATLDTNDVLAFVKEISSDGNVNTVDVIMPLFPILYVTNPEWLRLLLEPILQYLSSGRWPLPYVIHDIGTSYPNATGHDDGTAEIMPIEETGNLLILALAYQTASGNTSWASQYIPLLNKYAEYLPSRSLNITEQLSTNDATGPLTNETNLAIKAAVGMNAFASLAGAAYSNYSSIAASHVTTLYTDGLATDAAKTHFVLNYPSNEASWKIPFNLYPDLLLNLTTFPSSAYSMQETFYPSIRSPGGVALDSRQTWAKTDWNIWTAGTCSRGGKARQAFVDDLWGFVGNGKNSWPLSDRYTVQAAGGVEEGVEEALRGRPTVGGHFALLAVELGGKGLGGGWYP